MDPIPGNPLELVDHVYDQPDEHGIYVSNPTSTHRDDGLERPTRHGEYDEVEQIINDANVYDEVPDDTYERPSHENGIYVVNPTST